MSVSAVPRRGQCGEGAARGEYATTHNERRTGRLLLHLGDPATREAQTRERVGGSADEHPVLDERRRVVEDRAVSGRALASGLREYS